MRPFVKKLSNVWQIWVVSQTTRVRPSEILGIDDPYLSYCLDEAIVSGGKAIEADLEKITHKDAKVQAQRRQARLLKLIGKDTKRLTPQYQNPNAR